MIFIFSIFHFPQLYIQFKMVPTEVQNKSSTVIKCLDQNFTLDCSPPIFQLGADQKDLHKYLPKLILMLNTLISPKLLYNILEFFTSL
jgi:hypothetical protein